MDCIEKNFRTKVKKEHLKPSEKAWPCFTCRGLCKCNRCKQGLADELNLLSKENNIRNGTHIFINLDFLTSGYVPLKSVEYMRKEVTQL